MKNNLTIGAVFFIAISIVISFFAGRHVEAEKKASTADTTTTHTIVKVLVPVINQDSLKALIELRKVTAGTRAEAERYRRAYRELLADRADTTSDDSTAISTGDSLAFLAPVAVKDTIDAHQDTIHAEYHYLPSNFFVLKISPAPVTTTKDTIRIREGYQLPSSTFGLVEWGIGGVILGAILHQMTSH